MLRGQDEGEQRTAGETSNVGSPGNAACRRGLNRKHLESRDKLDQKPVPEQ